MSIKKIEELEKKQAQLKARIQKAKAKMNTEKRKKETRAKIIIGGVMAKMMLGSEETKTKMLNRIEKQKDRELVELVLFSDAQKTT